MQNPPIKQKVYSVFIQRYNMPKKTKATMVSAASLLDACYGAEAANPGWKADQASNMADDFESADVLGRCYQCESIILDRCSYKYLARLGYTCDRCSNFNGDE